jgi:hypothetical protein
VVVAWMPRDVLDEALVQLDVVAPYTRMSSDLTMDEEVGRVRSRS